MGAKRIKIADVVRDTKINRSTLNRIYHEKVTRIDYETLDKLCKYLECEVGELLIVK